MEREKILRADGARNRERILATARKLVARDGAHVSLEKIAQGARVGSATLHRHFSSRWALLEAVFRDGVEQLCARAAAQPGLDASAELTTWLEELTAYTASHRGLAAALLAAPGGPSRDELCVTDRVLGALGALVARASSAGALGTTTSTGDLLTLVNAIAAATEGDPDAARRVLRLALRGVWSKPSAVAPRERQRA